MSNLETETNSLALVRAGLCIIGAAIKFSLYSNTEWRKSKLPVCIHSFHPAVTAYLKELHSDTSEHELQQRGDNHDVPDGPDGHEDTLDNVLQDRQ